MIKNIELYSDSDLNMYLSGCVVGYKMSSGKIKAYYVQDVCDGVIHLNGVRSKTVDRNDDRLVTDWPTLGVVQTGSYVSYVMTESFDRQYKKSIRNRGLNIVIPMEREVRAAELLKDQLNLDDFTNMYNAEDITLSEALVQLENKLAVRVNRHFFLTWKSGYANPMIGYRDVIVGEVIDGVAKLFPSYKHLLSSVNKLTGLSED